MTPTAGTLTRVAFGDTDVADGAAEPVVVNRYRRRGQDRAYVRVDGRLVGFRDLYTGVAECTVVEHLDTLMDATDDLVHLGSARPAA